MKIGKEFFLFVLILISITIFISYLSYPKAFGRKCSCNPQCDFANLKIESCSYSSGRLKLKLTNSNIIDLKVIISYLVFPNKTYESRYLTDSIPPLTAKEFLIENVPSEIELFTVTTECPNIKLVKNLAECI